MESSDPCRRPAKGGGIKNLQEKKFGDLPQNKTRGFIVAAGEEIQYIGQSFKEVESGEGFENLSGEPVGSWVEVTTNCLFREKIYPGLAISQTESGRNGFVYLKFYF